MITIKAIIPRRLGVDPYKVLREVEKTMRKEVADDFKRDFGKTVRTWEEKPNFRSVFFKHPNQYVLTVAPSGEFADRYGWIDQGTRARIIVPKSPNTRLKFQGGPYKSKTRPGVIGSQQGGPTGAFVYPTIVKRYPGIKAREFSKAIAAQGELRFQRSVQDAMNRAVN